MKLYDIVIIGSGPAGMNAALYAARMDLSVAVIEKGAPGGKLVNISRIENWIGDEAITGTDLALRMNSHMHKYGIDSIYGEAADMDTKENMVILKDGQKVNYRFAIIATGSSEVIPEDIKHIHKFNTKGVHYCAICDAPLYKDEVVGVIGGGNSAIQEANYLAAVSKTVHIFVRSTIKADNELVEELMKKSNVIIHEDSRVLELVGDTRLEKVITTDGTFDMPALFPYVGLAPNTSFLDNTDVKTDEGFVIVDSTMKTNIDNIYSVGDVNEKEIRQVITAAADGTIAVKFIANKI